MSTYSGDVATFMRPGVRTDSVEHFKLVRTVQGPASKGMLPLIATGP